YLLTVAQYRLLCYACFSRVRPALPTPPLSPYTTLFRSATWWCLTPPPPRWRSWRLGTPSTCRGRCPPARFWTIGFELPKYPNVLDRKSTRLNSSHVSISYAVFCLKKTKTEYRSPVNYEA